MRQPTLLVQIVLMFVGTAPSSTGGGVRVTTLVLLFLIVYSQAKGGEEVRVFRRTLPRRLIAKALAVLTIATLLVMVGTLALMVSDELSLLPALFEVTSAFGTAGLSLGVTPELSAFAKVLVAAIMLVGRVGPTAPAPGPLVQAQTYQLQVSRGGHSTWLATPVKYARTRGRQAAWRGKRGRTRPSGQRPDHLRGIRRTRGGAGACRYLLR